MLDNVERWLATGIPADAAESKALYEQLRDAADAFGAVLPKAAEDAAIATRVRAMQHVLEGVEDMPVSYACALALVNKTADANADTMTLTLTGVTKGSEQRGDWTVAVKQSAAEAESLPSSRIPAGWSIERKEIGIRVQDPDGSYLLIPDSFLDAAGVLPHRMLSRLADALLDGSENKGGSPA